MDFYESLKNSIAKRLLSDDDLDMSKCVRILDRKRWPPDAKKNILFGEEEIAKLSHRFQLTEREMI